MTSFNGIEMNTQINQINNMMRSQLTEAQNAKSSIRNFINNNELQSESYTSQKNYFNTVYINLYSGIEYFANEFITANRRLQNQFLYVDNDTNAYINTDNLMLEVNNLVSYANYWLNIIDDHPYAEYYAGINKGLIGRTQAIIDRMNYFSENSITNYSTTKDYLDLVIRGINAIQNNCWDETTKTFNTSAIDTSWTQELSNKIVEEELKKCMKDGQITDSGYKYLQEVFESEFTDLTPEQIAVATILMANVDTEEEMVKTLELGYCVDNPQPYLGEDGNPVIAYKLPSETFSMLVAMSTVYLETEMINGNYVDKKDEYDLKMGYKHMLMSIIVQTLPLGIPMFEDTISTSDDKKKYGIGEFYEKDTKDGKELSFKVYGYDIDLSLVMFGSSETDFKDYMKEEYGDSYNDKVLEDYITGLITTGLGFTGVSEIDALMTTYGTVDAILVSASGFESGMFAEGISNVLGGVSIGGKGDSYSDMTVRLVDAIETAGIISNYGLNVSLSGDTVYVSIGPGTVKAVEARNNEIAQLTLENSYQEKNNYAISEFYKKVQGTEYEKIFFPNGESGGIKIPKIELKDFQTDMKKIYLIEDLMGRLETAN